MRSEPGDFLGLEGIQALAVSPDSENRYTADLDCYCSLARRRSLLGVVAPRSRGGVAAPATRCGARLGRRGRPTGPQAAPFRGPHRGERLAARRRRATLVATDLAGNRSLVVRGRA